MIPIRDHNGWLTFEEAIAHIRSVLQPRYGEQ